MKATKIYNAPKCKIIELDAKEVFLQGSQEEEKLNKTETFDNSKRTSGIWD